MIRDARERSRGRARGFTLVELLVVVSIICLLMSVMLPSLTRAQKQAEQAHCLANQHQLFLAWMLHSTNNDDGLCHSITSLKTYAPLDDVFICKTAKQKYEGESSYGISGSMGAGFCDGVMPYTRFHQVSHPGDCLVFVDVEGGIASSFWPLLRDQEQKRWLWRPWSWPVSLQGTTARHGNGCNMTFADGHGEMIHWKDQRTLGLIKGTVADEVQASEDNPDLDLLVRVLVGNRPVLDETEEGESTDGL